MRLDKYLSESGFGSRSDVKKMLKQKIVSVDGDVVSDGKFQVNSESCVKVKNEIIEAPGNTYYMFHKPKGCVCAASDEREKTIFSYIPQNRKHSLTSVGRLDKDTEGLLIVTDDGEFNHRLVSPKKHVNKVYYTEVTGEITQADVEAFREGIDIGDEKKTLPATLIPLKEDSKEDFEAAPWQGHSCDSGDDCCYIVISEGRYHQVKRMSEACGHKVTYLKRIVMGGLVLDPDLKPGEYRKLTEDEIKQACVNLI